MGKIRVFDEMKGEIARDLTFGSLTYNVRNQRRAARDACLLYGGSRPVRSGLRG